MTKRKLTIPAMLVVATISLSGSCGPDPEPQHCFCLTPELDGGTFTPPDGGNGGVDAGCVPPFVEQCFA